MRWCGNAIRWMERLEHFFPFRFLFIGSMRFGQMHFSVVAFAVFVVIDVYEFGGLQSRSEWISGKLFNNKCVYVSHATTNIKSLSKITRRTINIISRGRTMRIWGAERADMKCDPVTIHRNTRTELMNTFVLTVLQPAKTLLVWRIARVKVLMGTFSAYNLCRKNGK